MAKSNSSDAQAREQLTEEIHAAVDDEVRQMIQALVDCPDHELFGDTEFAIRDQLHKIGRLIYEKRLAQKKTAATAPPLTASTADAPPTSKGIGPEAS